MRSEIIIGVLIGVVVLLLPLLFARHVPVCPSCRVVMGTTFTIGQYHIATAWPMVWSVFLKMNESASAAPAVDFIREFGGKGGNVPEEPFRRPFTEEIWPFGASDIFQILFSTQA